MTYISDTNFLLMVLKNANNLLLSLKFLTWIYSKTCKWQLAHFDTKPRNMTHSDLVSWRYWWAAYSDIGVWWSCRAKCEPVISFTISNRSANVLPDRKDDAIGFDTWYLRLSTRYSCPQQLLAMEWAWCNWLYVWFDYRVEVQHPESYPCLLACKTMLLHQPQLY